MSSDLVAITGFVALFAMMLLRVPIGMAMGLVGVTGFGVLNGWTPALKLIAVASPKATLEPEELETVGSVPSGLAEAPEKVRLLVPL